MVHNLDNFHTFPFHVAFLDNFPPKIVNPSNVLNVTLYKTLKLNITAVDNDTIRFLVVNEPAGAKVDQTENKLYFTWNITSSQRVGFKLSFVVNFEDNYH